MTLLPILANPNLAILLILAGIFLIYVECNRPGCILPGCCGTLAVMLGIYGLVQPSTRPLYPPVALAAASLFTLVTVPLLRVALRARRNKRFIPASAPNLQPSPGPTPE